MSQDTSTPDLQHRVDMLGHFTRDVGHDVANMLTIILGQCRLTARVLDQGDVPRDRMIKAITAIEQNAERIRVAMDALRFYARLGKDEMPQMIPLDLVVGTAVTLSRHSLDKNSIGIDLDQQATSTSVSGKRSLITRLVAECLHVVIESANEGQSRKLRASIRRETDGRPSLEIAACFPCSAILSTSITEIQFLATECHVELKISGENDGSVVRLLFSV